MSASAPNTVVIPVPVDERAKREAEAVLARIGLTPSEFLGRAIEPDRFLQIALIMSANLEKPTEERAAFRDFVIERLRSGADASKDDLLHLRNIHNSLREILQILDAMQEALVPNEETVAAIEAARRGETKSFNTVQELLADLNSDADD
jgi:antitoxin component of RelBE/YafQ-DinJ toxin-antitoxin module